MQVDPMTPIRVDTEGVVHIGEEAAPPDAAKAEAVPFSLVPRLYDSFFAYECASVRPPAVADKVPASAATSAANDSILMVTVRLPRHTARASPTAVQATPALK
ncbi:hypothetical protein EON66_05645 [archaeon]|nr:MAG: hypothetical protein EON66_05645 [archaeon]